MAKIFELPVELLLDIFTFALQPETEELDPNEYYLRIPSSPEERRNLRNFCLVSKSFRDLAQPLLFRTFDENSQYLERTRCFVRTLYTRPELGQHVQNLFAVPRDHDWVVMAEPLSSEDQALVKSLIEDFQMDDGTQGWLLSLPNRPFINSHMALAAILTPNVTQLSVSGSIAYVAYQNASKQVPSYLSKVRQLNIINHDRHPNVPFMRLEADILTIFPQLEGIYFSHKDFYYEGEFWEPGTLDSERIEFHQCYMDNSFLQMFVRAHKKMKAFAYSTFELNPRIFRMGAPRYGPRVQFNAAQALEALSIHKNSLTSFQVEFERREADWEIGLKTFNSDKVKFGSFRYFNELKTIIVGHEYLPNHPEFPTSLEALSINDCNILNLPIQYLARNIADDCRKGLYPNLSFVKITGYEVEPNPVSVPDGQSQPFPKTSDEVLMIIQSLFDGCNVDIQITTVEPPQFPKLELSLVRMP